MRTEDFLIDCKRTDGTALLVDAGMLGKITFEAKQITKSPALLLELQTPTGCSNDWLCLPIADFVGMLELIREFREMKRGKKKTAAAKARSRKAEVAEAESERSPGLGNSQRRKRRRDH